MAIADEKYVSVSTRSPDGASHRARIVPLSDSRIALWTSDGAFASDGDAVSVEGEPHGVAQVVRSGRAFDEAVAKARKKYGWRARTSRINAIVLVTVDGT